MQLDVASGDMQAIWDQAVSALKREISDLVEDKTEYFKAAGAKFAGVLGGAPEIKFLKGA